MATCSSSTENGPPGSDGANDHDLANFSTIIPWPRLGYSPRVPLVVWHGLGWETPIPCKRPRHAPRPLCLSRREPLHSKGWEQTLQPCQAHPRPVVACANPGKERSMIPREASCRVEPTMEPVGRKKSVNTFHSGKATRKDKSRVSSPNLLGLHLHAPVPNVLVNLLGLSSNLLCRGIPELKGRQLRSYKIKESKAPYHRICSTFAQNRPGTVILSNIEVEVAGHLFLSLSCLLKRIRDWLPIVPIGQISLTHFVAHEKEVVFSIFNLALLLDGHHKNPFYYSNNPTQGPRSCWEPFGSN
ncbi:hypothetical protein Cgig2_031373 [Carnegiea gigantea]|uniref:Uncharacterized protein n=1 Tax=Carnegiea gigantea TaxID=171969 RepID=A0A9Q1Q4C9_9CARY|nr:hypothetical protein Cgig2_031373 [Carnegiea gigantea]